MQIKKLLEESQEVAFATLKNGFINNKKSHAYLLSGSRGTPLKETAIFLAQSFLCENPDPLACGECLTCIRVADGSYVDVEFIDGEKTSIKKEQIEALQTNFSRSAIEEKGLKIYIIHLIENTSIGAVNSLLKFLEEPEKNIIGIITTENISKVLTTIVSRCQVIRLKNYSKSILVSELIEAGVDVEDAKLMVQNRNDIDSVLQTVGDESFHAVKDLAIDTAAKLCENIEGFIYYMERNIEPMLFDRKKCSIYLEILNVIFKDVLCLSNPSKIVFSNQIRTLKSLQDKNLNLAVIMEAIMIAQGQLDANVNCALLLDRLFNKLLTEGGF